MYSRKTGTLYSSSEAQRKIDSFNNNLREQYRQRSNQPIASPVSSLTSAKKAENTAISSPTFEDILIIGLIFMLLLEEKKDYLIIGALAALVLIGR